MASTDTEPVVFDTSVGRDFPKPGARYLPHRVFVVDLSDIPAWVHENVDVVWEAIEWRRIFDTYLFGYPPRGEMASDQLDIEFESLQNEFEAWAVHHGDQWRAFVDGWILDRFRERDGNVT